jgi:hypothetical protein
MDCFEFMVNEILRLSSEPEPNLRTQEESILYVEKLFLSGYTITKETK